MRFLVRTTLLSVLFVGMFYLMLQQLSAPYTKRYSKEVEVSGPKSMKPLRYFQYDNRDYFLMYNYRRKLPNDSDVVMVKKVRIRQLTISESQQLIQKLDKQIEMDSAYLEKDVVKPMWYNYRSRDVPYPKEVPRKGDSQIPNGFFNIKEDINNVDPEYLINQPHVCNTKRMYLLVAVMSESTASPMRMAIRATWGRLTKVYGRDVRVVFMLGASGSSYHQTLIEAEGSQYHDIVQGSFYEGYEKLTEKTIMTLDWISKYCSNTKFVLKVNDNVVVNLYKTIRFVRIIRTRFGVYWGKVVYLENPKEKDVGMDRYISNISWTGKYFPPYCKRQHIIFTIDTIHKMNLVSRRTPLVFPDDLYLGILAEKLGFNPKDISDVIGVLHHRPDLADAISNATSALMIIETDNAGQMTTNHHKFWNLIQKNIKNKNNCVLDDREVSPVSLGDIFIES